MQLSIFFYPSDMQSQMIVAFIVLANITSSRVSTQDSAHLYDVAPIPIVMTLSEADVLGISDQHLSLTYPPRTKLKLKNRRAKKELYVQQAAEWLRFWEDFDRIKRIEIEEVFNIYHKFYFDEEGNIIYFLYKTDKNTSYPLDFAQYQQELAEYVKSFKFELKVGQSWSQCGSWSYK